MSASATATHGAFGRARSHARVVALLAAASIFYLHFHAACEASEIAAPAPALDAETGQLLSAYLVDPRGHRAAVLALRERGVENLPTAALLALADAYLRSGATSRATVLLQQAVARGVDPPLAGWAEYGLGWAALSSGELTEARSAFERARAAEWNTASVGTLIGIVDAAEGRGLEAVRELTAQASDPSASTITIQVARLGSAYAHYWSGEFGAARRAFLNLAGEFPTGPFADDARYAAAWSAFRAGDHDEAVRGLRDLAGQGRQPLRGVRVSRSLLNLETRAVLGDGLRRYRRGRYGVRAVDDQIADLLNLDGVGLARAALVRVEAPADDAGAEPGRAVAGASATAEDVLTAGGARINAPVVRPDDVATGSSAPVDAWPNRAETPGANDWPRRPGLLLVMLAIVAVVLGWLWRRPLSKAGVDALRAGRPATKQEVWRRQGR